MRIILEGPVPSKKNLLRRSKDGRLFRDHSVAEQIEALTRQAQMQWRRDPAVNPAIRAHFYCRDQRSDIDNKWTTVQDCLVAAGVLKNDNLKHLAGPITISGEVGEERVVIELDLRQMVIE